MREVTLLLLLPIFVHGRELLDIPTTTFRIPRNAQEGDLIVGSQHIRASKDLDESLNLELEGTNPSPIAINGSIVDAGQPVKFVLVNKNAFENGKSQVKLQALGVISGKVQEATIHFEVESSSDLPTIPQIPNFVVRNDFQDKETAIVKVSSKIPANSELEVLGHYAERVQASFQEDNIILDTVPCEDNEPCDIAFPFTVILVLKNGENHVESLMTFEEEKKSTLKMDQKVYETTIEEHTGEQDRLVKVTAKGNSSEILYSLRDASGLFSIHPKEGLLSILHPEFLTISSFGEAVNLTVVATDGENTVNAVVKVKIAPEIEKNVVFGFEKENYEIEAENTEKFLGNIRAKFPNPVVYRITEGRSDLYQVEGNGDVKYVGKLLKDDREDAITVAVQEATGGLKMASAKVNVHLKGIGSFPVTTSDDLEQVELVSADEPAGVVLTSIQFNDEDADAKLEYSLKAEQGVDENGNLVAEDAASLFEVKSGDDNQAHLVISKGLKKSQISSVQLEITARDMEHPKEPEASVRRTIVIQREKEEEVPKELNFIALPDNITVPLDLPVGSFIYRAVVLPKKSNLTFSIEPEHIFKIFNDGSVITKKDLVEEPQSIRIQVTVTDGNETKSSESNLILKKKLRAHFTEERYEANVPRGSPEGTLISLVSAVSEKSEAVTDFVLKGGHSKMFSVDNQGAVKSNGALTEGSAFDFLVALASDPTITAPVHVKLDEVRAASIILTENQIFASVFDNLPINSYVGRVEVKGNEKVKFTMNSEEKGMNNLFAIEEDGTIRSIDWLSGSAGMHKFTVLASNIDQAGVRSANATVVIDVLKSNECAPRFKPDENLIFYVRENTPRDTVIGKVAADILPGKCDLEYSLGDEEALSINSANGELKTVKEFDFEKQKSYVVKLKLVAGKHNSESTSAELRILDVDDHQVHFDLTEQTVDVPEDTPTTTVVATVRAVEKDEQPVFYHLAPSSPPQFSLHSTTGAVIVEQPLDRETDEQFVIEIGASNSVNTVQADWPTKMKLIVKVKDVNDNGPIFDRSHYLTVVEKDIVVGSKIIEVHAVDPDVDDQEKKLEYTVTGASFEYRGMSRNVEGVLDINPVDGKVYTLRSLSDYVGGVFNVHLQVRDTVDGTIGKAGLKMYVHDNSDLLSMELPYAPSTVTPQVVDEFSQLLSNSTGLWALPRKVSYKAPHGIMSTNSVDLQLIFFNKTLSEIVPAEKVLAIREMNPVKGLPELRKPTSSYLMNVEKRSDTFIQPELFFIVLGFLVLLAIVLSLCGMMACFARSRFLREKKIVENEMAIKDAIQFPSNRSPALVSFKHYAPPTSEIYRNHEEHMYRSPNLNEKVGSYAVQQATITVAEHEEKI
ncbi:unnamed protein product [Caenorhabditis sp. 36 PRJEB53466]|nr:unnamed protein product [Caenorhabditis sp. 36 PRJEB53466]